MIPIARMPKIQDRLFYYALGLSLLFHLIFLIVLSITHPEVLKKSLDQIEVTYQAVKSKSFMKKNEIKPKNVKVFKEEQERKKVKIVQKEEEPIYKLGKDIKDIRKFKDDFKMDRKQIPKIRTLDTGRKITIPMVKADKIANAQYLNYYQNIRQIIKRRAYAYEDHPDLESGDVYLSFILSSDGQLKAVKILEDKTRAGEALRKIGLRIIQESSPFPPFSVDLDYPELTFNVVISFEVN